MYFFNANNKFKIEQGTSLPTLLCHLSMLKAYLFEHVTLAEEQNNSSMVPSKRQTYYYKESESSVRTRAVVLTSNILQKFRSSEYC